MEFRKVQLADGNNAWVANKELGGVMACKETDIDPDKADTNSFLHGSSEEHIVRNRIEAFPRVRAGHNAYKAVGKKAEKKTRKKNANKSEEEGQSGGESSS